MSHVIKFRAWDKVEQRWRYSTDSDHVSYFWLFVETELDHETGKTLTQFTGRKDKHDKEIYGGDRVQLEKPGYEGSLGTDIGWIVYDAQDSAWRVQSYSWWCYLYQAYDIEVIGNSYEALNKPLQSSQQ